MLRPQVFYSAQCLLRFPTGWGRSDVSVFNHFHLSCISCNLGFSLLCFLFSCFYFSTMSLNFDEVISDLQILKGTSVSPWYCHQCCSCSWSLTKVGIQLHNSAGGESWLLTWFDWQILKISPAYSKHTGDRVSKENWHVPQWLMGKDPWYHCRMAWREQK